MDGWIQDERVMIFGIMDLNQYLEKMNTTDLSYYSPNRDFGIV